ncbi:hypothetical protein BD779DRAFT_1048114 [Infundibulicybe gibba]|nr:hypothetical protein BD779DRAFT_1048114 [Infundibulicybe gibba]
MNGTPVTPDPHLHHPRDYKPCEPSYPSPSRPSGVDGGYQAQRAESRLSRARSRSHRSVGPKRNNAHNTEDSDGDHPMDTPGEETGENARIWKVYLFEAEKADSALADGCNRSMDVLLVFTGLFSAVLTTFIIQSYQLMIPSPTDTTNILLTRLISLHDSNLTSSVPSGGPTTPSQEIHWVNGLWFAALSCSLSTALMSMLAKQWVQAYTPNVSGSPRLRARQRQLKYMQLEIWHVIPIINALPLFLHVALLLFFAGLVVLLWTTDIGTTIATLIIVLLAYLFYFVSIWLSVLDPDCPYQHPISEHIRKWITRNHPRRKAPGDLSTTSSRSLDLEGAITTDAGSPKLCNERLANDKLDASALLWLLERSSDSVVVSTTLQAIAGLPRDFSSLPILHGANAVSRVEESFRRCFYIDTSVDVQWHLLDPESAGLYCRAWLRLTRGTNEKWPFELLEPILILQDVKTHPDCAAIASCAVALSSPNSHLPQWKLISCLVMYSTGEIHLNPSTLCWLLDSLVECAIRWEMATSVIDRTTHRGVPAFFRLLQSTQDKPLGKFGMQ